MLLPRPDPVVAAWHRLWRGEPVHISELSPPQPVVPETVTFPVGVSRAAEPFVLVTLPVVRAGR